MEKSCQITGESLWIPVQTGGENQCLEIFVQEESKERKLYEFQIPTHCFISPEGKYTADYYAKLPVSEWKGKKLVLRGSFSTGFYEAVTQETITQQETAQTDDKYSLHDLTQHRPLLHFTPMRGWINDPNGLVYHNGLYHMYFQYNPFDIRWENMSWGHAISSDLLHWIQQDTVLFPDEQGTIFSGSGIVNDRNLLGLPEDSLIFFYTAAGGKNLWSQGKEFTQRIAYSLDGGQTLVKDDRGMVDTISWENRDPKVFWHEESQAYIMVLWLENNDFGILRSVDLNKWTLSSRITLEGGWECPDLVQVCDSQWVFLTADGYYYWGRFDGSSFQTDGLRHKAYLNTVPYAAQTYSNTENRVIFLPWLRLPDRGRLYTGAMGLPRELGIFKRDGEQKLSLCPVREYYDVRREISLPEGLSAYSQQGKAMELELNLEGVTETVSLLLNETVIIIDRKQGIFQVGSEIFEIPVDINDYSLLIDDVILEVTADYGTIVGMFELAVPGVDIRVKVPEGTLRLYEVY